MNPLTGWNNPQVAMFGGTAAFSDKNPTLNPSEWEEHEQYDPYFMLGRAQQNNNCTNAAISPGIRAMYEAAGQPCPELSPTYQYARCNGGRDAGAMCRDVISGCMLKGKGGGLPKYDLCPEGKIYIPRGGFPAAVVEDAQQRIVFEAYQCFNWAEVMTALTLRFMVYHGFVLGNAFDNANGDGVVPSWDGRRTRGHAMLSIGAKKISGRWRTKTPNTWGKNWGKNGVGFIDETYFWGESGNYVNLEAFAIRAVVIQ